MKAQARDTVKAALKAARDRDKARIQGHDSGPQGRYLETRPGPS